MSNVSISELAPAASLSGVELLEIVQGGASKSATALQIAGTRTIVLADISDMTGYGRVVAASASLSELMDGYFGSTQGTVPYRGAASWSALAPGTLGQVLQTRGAGQNPIWATVSGVGTVVQVDTGTGLTGGPITSSGTISVASNGITYALMQQVSANNRLLGNNSGAAGNVSELTASQALDMVGSTRGSVLYRGASGWAILAPGTASNVLISNGAGADPSWSAASSGVTNVATGSGLTGGPITSTGTISVSTNGITYALFQQVAASSLVGNPTGALANAQGITLGATLAFSGTALQTAALTGDVTASANSFATTIAANAVTTAKIADLNVTTIKIADNNVTYAKFQQVAASSIVGNPTGALANAQGVTLGATLTFSGTALQTAALTGDVTASANSFATTVAANAVTYAKFQQVAASSLVGNPTGALANAQGITLGSTLTFSGTSLRTAALTGDVTASANSFATTIASGVVTYAKMASAALATASQVRSATASTLIPSDVFWSAQDLVSLTDAATVSVDLSAGINFTLTTTSGVGATRALGNPIKTKVGQSGVIYVIQDATGSRALTYGDNYKFAGGVAPSLSTAANTVDRLTYFVRSSSHIDIDISRGRA